MAVADQWENQNHNTDDQKSGGLQLEDVVFAGAGCGWLIDLRR